MLPYHVVWKLPGFLISPHEVKAEKDRSTRWLLLASPPPPLPHLNAIYYGHTLDRILWEILYADPILGPIYILKSDARDGFY